MTKTLSYGITEPNMSQNCCDEDFDSGNPSTFTVILTQSRLLSFMEVYIFNTECSSPKW